MADARADRLRDLAWPPTCACYVSRLNHVLRQLIEQAERFEKGSSLPGYNAELGERDLWCEVYGVQNLLRISTEIPKDDHAFFRRLWDAERWLDRILAGVQMADPRFPPPGSKDHARRLSSPEHVEAFRQILERVPDPFDCPNGQALALFEWARHHLGTDPDDWDFEAKADQRFKKRWAYALVDDDGHSRPEAECREIRRRLLTEAGLLRTVPAGEPTAPAPGLGPNLPHPGVGLNGSEQALPFLLRSLAELRPRFATRIDDDLNFLDVAGRVSMEALKPFEGQEDDTAFEEAKEAMIALPPDDDPSWGDNGWREGKPIVRNLQALMTSKQLYYFRSDLKRDPKDDPAFRRAVEKFEKEASLYCHYSRHVLFGTADMSSVDDFDRWADLAGRS